MQAYEVRLVSAALFREKKLKIVFTRKLQLLQYGGDKVLWTFYSKGNALHKLLWWSASVGPSQTGERFLEELKEEKRFDVFMGNGGKLLLTSFCIAASPSGVDQGYLDCSVGPSTSVIAAVGRDSNRRNIVMAAISLIKTKDPLVAEMEAICFALQASSKSVL
ncbi:hypothetical protein L484_021478 [Morus notabilis]|uniref:Uncharacterized protein n=1 Tax=Morus notabilis TaxID=981085 RepID=W9SMH1_9ROSA|nr:hypothetical protein L484_021478 [Morus notabilis]